MMHQKQSFIWMLVVIALTLPDPSNATAQNKSKRKRPTEPDVQYPPKLPDGKEFVSFESDKLLLRPEQIPADVLIAKKAPKIDLLYYPGQTYAGHPWSNWGDSIAVGEKYYASIGDHLAPQGNAFVYEYDPKSYKFRLLADIAKTLELPDGHYVPGKIHTRLDVGRDGWIYFGTHRGSTRVTSDQYHYQGDWIMRCDPNTAKCEVVARNPVPKHCIPTAITDGQRMIFYASTAPGSDAEEQEIQFFAYDLEKRETIYSGTNGPSRAIVLASSTGMVYYTPGKDDSPLMKFQSGTKPTLERIDGKIGIRAATAETNDGIVYTVSSGQQGSKSTLYALETKTGAIKTLGDAGVGTQNYIATLDVDPTGRYLYYVPGAHGGSYRDGTPIIQYDTVNNQRKVLAFLEPYVEETYGCSLRGTYSVALSPTGDKLFVTWNASRGSRHWDCCVLTVVHIPASER